MNIKVLVLIIGFFCGGCSQKKEVTMITQNPHITAKNIVEEINKEVKHYNSEKNFMISYENYNCYFEVFVNDIPCYRYFKEPASSSAFDLNQCIFKNGIQKITYKMYPATDENAEIKNFIESTYLKLKVESYDKKNKNAEDILYQDYKTPEIEGIDQYGHKNKMFIAKGKTYYEGSFTFEATVPYQLQGFDKMQDLRKMDKKVLEQKLLAKYQEVWQVYNNKQYDDIARISFDKMKDQFIATYDTKEGIAEGWNNVTTGLKNDTFEMQPLKDYKLAFLADGKLVVLMQTSNDRRNRGKTALWGKYKIDERTRATFFYDYFYIPEGETEFKVY
ncbi:hypothetical protein FLACOL_01259 [Flavobacterium columnare]|uniref:Lipoprotein n=2 Tax=Flavobacterium TaxID=237 RepID=A0ABW8PK65_9FLAO|nr:hypothetical protein [Flavobacterium columnare]SPE77266.1 hypothetical protein FLACOL_01259 [Flavobacterium columnare]